MTVDLTPEALDALNKSLRKIGGHGFPNWADDAADAITALRAENEALQRYVDTYRKHAQNTIEAEARATAAEAALAAAMEGAVRVRGLEWAGKYRPMATPEPYQIWPDNGASGAPDDPFESYRNYMLYSPHMMVIGEFDTIEEAKEAAQVDYGYRILAALEPNPAAQDREALIAATLEMAESVAINAGPSYYMIQTGTGFQKTHTNGGAFAFRTDISDAIRALATQPQTDALAARDAKMRAEGMRMAAEIAGGIGRPVGAGDGDTYVPGTSGEAQRAILAAAQKEAWE
ncbi:hypothetical protein [Pararhodobacter sp. CCB-MM2]|uniref:hypothetical protein n=1 Tax=Pararhodobacter sp. CCB-MM2 TaxID=1786003 RepID=UPI00082E5BA3|nr:hypothetical protein [Pararhodobacter sp. CCB-MM2]